MDPIELTGLNQQELLIQAITTLNGLTHEVNGLRASVTAIAQIQDREALECVFNPRRTAGENGLRLLERVNLLEAAVDQFRGAVGFVKMVGVSTLVSILLMIFIQIALQIGMAVK